MPERKVRKMSLEWNGPYEDVDIDVDEGGEDATDHSDHRADSDADSPDTDEG